MKILLIQPPSCQPWMDGFFVMEPLALEYLAAGLKLDGHAVEILDTRFEPDYEAAFKRLVPDVVGITGYTSHFPAMRRIARRLKSIRPETVMVVGGVHASAQPEDFNESSVDYVVIGEGVCTLRELVGQIEKQEPAAGVRGLAIPGEGMSFTEPRAFSDPDELAFPDRSLTAKHRRRYSYEWSNPVALIRTSLGCKARCHFCSAWSLTGGKYLRRQPEKIVEELRTIREPHVHFCDDEAMLDARRMDHLADLIEAARIRKKYFTYARTDTIIRHPELFAKWRKIGLTTVFVGMESYSDSRLRDMNKGVTIDQHLEAIRILKKLGIFLYAQYMVDPAFTADDFKAMTDHVRGLRLRYASFTILTPLPGSILYREKKHQLTTDRFELFDVFHAVLPTTLPIEEFYMQFAKLYMNAVSLSDGLRTLLRYGWGRLLPQMKLGKQFIAAIQQAHLD